MTLARPLALAALMAALAACAAPQSALEPAGPAAEWLRELFFVMLGGAVLIYLFVMGCLVWAVFISPGRHPNFKGTWFIMGGGVVLPAIVLTSLLVYSFVLGRELTPALPDDALRIEVVGKRWWWEVRYLPPGSDEPVVSANELRLPAGQPVELLLSSTDVIHSFWVPSLAGKMDMIPGRVNRLVLEADEPGIYRGQCAEYCGGAHALMAFYAVAEPPEMFEAWLEREAQDAREPVDPFLAGGRDLFIESGCGACHTVRGTPADGLFGPDLTHVGNRHSIGAGILPNNVGTIAGWIADTQHIKPDNNMPAFNTFSGRELRAISAWLESLE